MSLSLEEWLEEESASLLPSIYTRETLWVLVLFNNLVFLRFVRLHSDSVVWGTLEFFLSPRRDKMLTFRAGENAIYNVRGNISY